MNSRRWKLTAWLIPTTLLALEGLASISGVGLLQRLYAGRPYHFREVDKGVLYRDGLRNPHQFAGAVRKSDAKTIVSVLSEKEIVTERFAPAIDPWRNGGIATECLNISEDDWPDTEAIRKFLAIVADPARRPVLVHCREGVRRTGMLVAAYQLSVLKFSKEQARAAIERFDHGERTVRDLHRFIELYDPVSASVMYDFQTNADRSEISTAALGKENGIH